MGDNQGNNYFQDQQYNYDPNMYNQQQQVIYQVPTSEVYYEDDDDYENLEAIEQEMNKELGITDNLDDDMLDEIEAEMEKSPTVKTGGAYVPAAAVPRQNGKLSQFAGEFWFPECRNCSCCKGFKHGCDCCKAGDGIDTCTNSNCIDGVFNAKVTEELANRGGVINNGNTTTGPTTTDNSTSKYIVEPPSPIIPKTNTTPAPALVSSAPGTFCKFEMSPSGCRFGAACHFKHTQSTNNLPPSPYYRATTYPPQPMQTHMYQQSSGNVQKCLYFARGNCNTGDSCRFSHY